MTSSVASAMEDHLHSPSNEDEQTADSFEQPDELAIDEEDEAREMWCGMTRGLAPRRHPGGSALSWSVGGTEETHARQPSASPSA